MIRQATVQDAAEIAQIHVETWQHAYKGIVPSSYLESLSITQRTAFWSKEILNPATGTLLSIDDAGRTVGWTSFGPSRDDDGVGLGELYAIYLLSTEWRKGYGKGLMNEMEKALSQKGFSSITLWVLELNSRTCRFYEKSGYKADGAKKKLNIAGTDLVEIRCRKTV